MDLNNLCEMLCLPGQVREAVLAAREVPGDLLADLTRRGRGQGAYEKLKALCTPENRGLDMLAFMLRAALLTWENYQRAGLPRQLFLDTMGCFPRFVGEHLASFGCYGFDRGFWAHRQLSMVLFRVGELEYELLDGEISMHIPSDARLDIPACADSLARFRQMLPDRAEDPIYVESWLLSPALRELLGEGSRILAFQHCFTCESWNREGSDFLQWVYGRTDIPFDRLPEDTTLRRRMKQHLLKGGKIGEAKGWLIDFV
ncbi:MAG: acyltransferase domain-containing protein [Eubacteriales bacterium]|nr:acyltransferase domain-containing protein [Eubacteriales bacterium]